MPDIRKLFPWFSRIIKEAYAGATRMGKGGKLKYSDVGADFEKFENFFFKDAHAYGIITTIADSMAESGISYIHESKPLADQANALAAEYELNTMLGELTTSNMVFGNSFIMLEEGKDFDFLEQLNPKSLSIDKKDGRHAGWKFYDDSIEAVIPRDNILHIPTNRLAGSTWGISPLQPLTRIMELKEEIETNLMFLVKRYLVPRYVYLLGKEGTSVPQEVIDEFAKSLANPDVAQDQVFENNIKIETLGTQYKALHVGYILDYVIKSLHTGLAFPDSFYIAKGSTESTAKIQTEIFNKKRIGGLQRTYTRPMKQIMGAILDREGIKYDKLPEPKWGQLSGTSLEAKVEYILRLAGITDAEGNRAVRIPELRTFMAKELGIELEPSSTSNKNKEAQAIALQEKMRW